MGWWLNEVTCIKKEVGYWVRGKWYLLLFIISICNIVIKYIFFVGLMFGVKEFYVNFRLIKDWVFFGY